MSALLSAAFGADPSARVETASFVLALRSRGISDLGLLRAMEIVPRDLFAPRRYQDLARQDVALPLPFGETMTAPGTVAAMLAALDVRPGQRILEVGTGSGYVTALLGHMGAAVLSFERHPVLAESARQRLKTAGLAAAITVECGNGFDDVVFEQQFDRIVLNGAVPKPLAWVTSLLAPGGRLVCGIVGEGGPTSLLTLTREEDGSLAEKTSGAVRLSRLRAVPEPRSSPETEA